MSDRAKPDLRLRPVIGQAWLLYRRLFGRTIVVATAVFGVLQLVEALAATRADSGAKVLALALALGLSVVGTQLVQGTLAEAVSDLRDGPEPPSNAELYARTRPKLGTLVAAAAVAKVLRLMLTVFAGAGAIGAAINVGSGLPPFWAAWIGGAVAGALTMPFVAHALTVVYFRLTEPEEPRMALPAAA